MARNVEYSCIAYSSAHFNIVDTQQTFLPRRTIIHHSKLRAYGVHANAAQRRHNWQEEEEYKIVCEKKWNSTAPATIVRIQEQKPPTTTHSALVVVSPHVSTQGSTWAALFWSSFQQPKNFVHSSITAIWKNGCLINSNLVLYDPAIH